MADEKKQELHQKGGIGSRNYQSGRDMYVDPTIINYDKRVSAMKKLIELYYKEKKEGKDSLLSSYIKKLERYTNQNEGDLQDLESKLKDGGYEEDIPQALEQKQKYAMQLKESTFSVASQQIHVLLLSRVIVNFNNYVLPQLKKNASKEAIKDLIVNMVIIPVEELACEEENVLSIYADDINNMLYYLTGNCHIKWV